ncbi:hypothetical protein BGY98DRAFT_1011015, partial [Russula aff. rugulosa BPL654]
MFSFCFFPSLRWTLRKRTGSGSHKLLFPYVTDQRQIYPGTLQNDNRNASMYAGRV